eukprot:TRINITY_DN5621_c0_g3_i1.p1 TRINITY_DN5621_c0_g3~~TRINITY_DN5621_c0_g3_i1.p1  ORF type:complete len:359 (-),score=81.03 TRINITY_DN5621_c0_g3_i1:532-1608(-)
MPPEGLVGVDEVCILGYNKNKGESITLRLRTDNLQGFRKYLVIRDTLIHELCHNEFSEHDSRFWALFYQLKREIVEFDRAAVGQAVGGRRGSDFAQFDYEDDDSLMDVDSNGHVLDPHHDHHHHSHDGLSAAEKARLAAERRLAELPKVEPIAKPNESKPTSAPSTLNPPPTISAPAPAPPAQDVGVEDKMDVVVDSNQNAVPPNMWRCAECTYDNPLDSKSCEMCGTVSASYAATLPSIEPELADPQVELNDKIQRSIDEFVRPLSPQDRSAALSTLDKIYSNIISHPNEAKYRTVSMTSKTFLNNIGRHFGAMDHLQVVGFAPDPANKDVLKLVRDDIVRLYLASSAVKAKLSGQN